MPWLLWLHILLLFLVVWEARRCREKGEWQGENIYFQKTHKCKSHAAAKPASPPQEDRTCVPVWLEVVWVLFWGYYGFAWCNRIVIELEQLVWCYQCGVEDRRSCGRSRQRMLLYQAGASSEVKGYIDSSPPTQRWLNSDRSFYLPLLLFCWQVRYAFQLLLIYHTN